jgi:hypothetical protein
VNAESLAWCADHAAQISRASASTPGRMSGFSGLDGQIDSAAEQSCQLTHHRRNTQQAMARAGQEIHEEADIAIRPHVAARGRTEQG